MEELGVPFVSHLTCSLSFPPLLLWKVIAGFIIVSAVL